MDVLFVMNSDQIIFWLSAVVSFIAMVAIIIRAGKRPVQGETPNGVSLAEVAAPWLTAAAADYRTQAIATVPELLRIAEAAYQGGESTLLELLDAYRGALDTETTAHDLEWQARTARIDYDLLTGSTPE